LILSGVWKIFEDKVFSERSTQELFNMYRDNDSRYDKTNGVAIRKKNLHSYLASFSKKPEILLVGEAPGPNGCRFSGVPFTGENELSTGQLPFGGEVSSTFAKPKSEMSGKLFWKTLAPLHGKMLVWNCVPFHPFKQGKPLSIRTPRKTEVAQYAPILQEMIQEIKPKKVVAIGRNAQASITSLGLNPLYVRHPSMGGATRFVEGMKAIQK
jgi:uracil-DNA glycosylase